VTKDSTRSRLRRCGTTAPSARPRRLESGRRGAANATLSGFDQPFVAYLSAPENSTDLTASSPTTQASWPG